MRSIVVSLITLAAASAQAAGTVSVSYAQPDKFADVGPRRDIEGNLKQLSRHFEELASRHLADGQKLSIEVLDVDLAGEMRPSRRAGQDVRVLKGAADWPRITLRYTLESADQPPRSGERNLSDMAYLQRINRYHGTEALRYERQMLDEWFAGQFGTAVAK